MMYLLWLILAIAAPSPPAPPFQFYAARRNGAMFMDQRNHPMFFSCGDEILHSGWLLVDVRRRQGTGGNHSVAIVARESDGRLAELWFDIVPRIRDLPAPGKDI